MMKNDKRFWIIGIVVLIPIAYIYLKGIQIFFQQDEWLMFGRALTSTLWRFTFPTVPIGESVHFIPLGNFIKYVAFVFLQFNYTGYNLVGLSIHFLNAFLIFKLIRSMKLNQYLALFGSLIFLSSNVASEIVFWPVASLNMLALSFGLTSWILIYQLKQSNRVNYLLAIILLTLGAVMIIEYALGLLIFIPLALILSYPKVLQWAKSLKLFTLLVLIYLALRFYLTAITHANNPITNLIAGGFYHKLLSLPLKYMGQITNVNNLLESFNPFVSLTAGQVAAVCGFILMSIIIFCWFVSRKRYPNTARNFLVVLIFIVTSSIPFLFVPFGGGLSLLPGRYLIFGLSGFAVFCALFIDVFIKLRDTVIVLISILILITLALFGIRNNNDSSNLLYQEGQTRLKILHFFVSEKPTLSKQTVFYTESDSSFYGLPEGERILPFQSGFGQTLLVWYQPSSNLPNEFFEHKFLWDIISQGYQQIDDRGFGYFRDFNLLAMTIKQQNIKINSVYGFRFDSTTQKIEDNTEEVRGRLQGYFAAKQSISNIGLSSNLNSSDLQFALDNNRSTYWDSKLPYINPQYIVVDLNSIKKVAEVSIDSGMNKDQGKVGYEILVSNDQINWTSVFYSKLYPPNNDGIVNIFFKPTATRFIKIEQIGSHKYASWIISELKVYEAID